MPSAPRKRDQQADKDDEPPAKKTSPTIQLDAGFKWNLQALAKAAESVETGGKSPVSALNELGVRVSYSVLRQGGPAHCPSFTVAVTVADMTFEGWGHSKREARASAARTCLSALLARAGRVLPNPGPQPDFTSDEPPKYPVSEFQCIETKIQPPEGNEKKATPPPGLFGPSVTPVHKSPINTLYENYPGITFICTFGDGSPLDTVQAPVQLSHSMRFKVVCQIKNQTFEGYGSSKKLAKLAAARSALGELCERGTTQAQPAAADALPQALADHIAKLVNEKFNELMKGDLVHSKRKVLAGIVMTIDYKIEGAKVIAVTTGTKCVSGEHMSVRGRAVNDCHAEVAARRCLQRHLYAQLLMYANAADPTVPIPESDIEPIPGGGYQLRPDRQLHLYVSTAPCGDGRIFSPHEHHETEPDRHPNRLARGQLRTKIESGEGTIPVKNCTNVLQTWDGVLQGERLLTMSCSDKAARWCVSGLQGALLARLLRPVYLRSLVLGSLLHHHHLHRAICGRIEGYISALPPPYQLTRPLLARAASTEARTPARAPSFSVCWSITSPLPEIINATTGKLENGHPSLLCKQSMFARWQYLVRRLPLLPQDPSGPPLPPLPKNLDYLLYNEAKALCTTYQVAKETLTSAFERAQLGRWIKKPIEQDQFQCEILEADPALLFAWAGDAQGSNIVQINAGISTDTEKIAQNLNNDKDVKTVNKNYDKSLNVGENTYSDVKLNTCGRNIQTNGTIAIRNVDNGKVVGERFDSKSYDGKFSRKEEVRNVELDKYERDSLLSCDRTDSQCRDGFSNSVVKSEKNKFKNESSGIDKAVLKVKSEILGTYNDNARWSENFNKGINKSNVNNDTCSANSQKAQLVDDNDNLINRISKLNIDPNKENKNLLDQKSVKVNKNTSKSFKMFNNNINIHNNMSYNSASKSTFEDKGVFKSDDDIYENNNLCDNIVIESKVGDVIDENGSKIETALKPKHTTDEEDRKNNNDTENNLDFNYIGNTINSNNIDKYDSNVKKVFSKILARKTFNDQNTDTSKYYKNNNEYKIFDKQKQLPHDNYSIDNTKGSIILSNKNLDSLDSDVDIDASNNNIVLEDNFNKINKNLNVFDAKSSNRSSLLQTKLAIYKRVHLK